MAAACCVLLFVMDTLRSGLAAFAFGSSTAGTKQ
jgi:hypothetical protein